MNKKNRSILITGGTGSFGKRFIKYLLELNYYSRIIVFSRDELKQYEMQKMGYDQNCMRYFIGDIRDYDRLRRAFESVNVVIHAAALKQVPSCEYNPLEAIKTNILGSSNVINAALDMGVEKVIALSTDKAVNPVNLYGATKLAAEKLFIQSNTYAGKKPTRFSCVRYGNVVGSRGSVIPLFVNQKNSGYVTITDERMTRFWITLDQGVKFVYKCLEFMNGGEIFVPKIPSMRIVDLAKIIAPNDSFLITGIRSGEKLHETLISIDEAKNTVEMEDMYIIQPSTELWFNKNLGEKGKPLLGDFSYTSDTNPRWLDKDEILNIISSLS
ncbi:MAG: UDP-N-acetylglucosamine 4,6-dehydratase (inverting) [Candidatus Methanofastidiosa archaeon]|nr:UDP-N-acetylglucosamine 4,6-dehydratase (inverting) [Candidatus Methanofastidiosa archaeon]